MVVNHFPNDRLYSDDSQVGQYFQLELRVELARRGCPLPAPLEEMMVFPRAVRGQATLVRWRRGDSTSDDWGRAVRQPHDYCVELPPGVFLLDLDYPGALKVLGPRLPDGFGLVASSPGRYHVWICGETPPRQYIGQLDRFQEFVEVHGEGRMAILPPSLHIGIGRPYRWLRRFLGAKSTTSETLGIVVKVFKDDRLVEYRVAGRT